MAIIIVVVIIALLLIFSWDQISSSLIASSAGPGHSLIDPFDAFEVSSTEQRVVRKGDTLRSLTKGRRPVPAWLLNHYNPDVNLGALKPGNRVTIPKIEKRNS